VTFFVTKLKKNVRLRNKNCHCFSSRSYNTTQTNIYYPEILNFLTGNSRSNKTGTVYALRKANEIISVLSTDTTPNPTRREK
jgi:hypothetical protein